MPEDGSCMFHALAFFLPQEVTANALRTALANHIERSADVEMHGMPLRSRIEMELSDSVSPRFQPHQGIDSFHAYIAATRAGEIWGGQIDMELLALIYKLHVKVYERVEGTTGHYTLSYEVNPTNSRQKAMLAWRKTANTTCRGEENYAAKERSDTGEHFDVLI